MLKFINDKNGIMGLTLSQLGLIIATGIIIAAVFSVIFFNDWHRKAELKNTATSFSTIVEGMDTRFFENSTIFRFIDRDYNYNVSISTEYIVVSSDGFWDNRLSFKKRFLRRPWPRENNPDWVSADGLHTYLNDTYGSFGNESDPIDNSDISDVKEYINDERDIVNLSFALKPFYVDIYRPVYIEKAFIFYDTDGDNIWDKLNDEKQGLLLVYQK